MRHAIVFCFAPVVRFFFFKVIQVSAQSSLSTYQREARGRGLKASPRRASSQYTRKEGCIIL